MRYVVLWETISKGYVPQYERKRRAPHISDNQSLPSLGKHVEGCFQGRLEATPALTSTNRLSPALQI
jgi:hypothetical protein